MNMNPKVSLRLVGVLIATTTASGCGGGSPGTSVIEVDCLEHVTYVAVSDTQTPEFPEAQDTCDPFEQSVKLGVRVTLPIDYMVFKVDPSRSPDEWPLVGCVHFQHERQRAQVHPYSSVNTCQLPNLQRLSPPSTVVSVAIRAEPELSKIDVTSASYGAGSCGVAAGNVTGIVASRCNGLTSCSVFVDNSVFGDPAPGCAKDFSVVWNCGDVTAPRSASHVAVVGEGYTVAIGCS